MSGRQPYAEQCTRVYTRTGRVAHLLSPVQTIRNGSVLCSVLPEWFTEWHGTGSQAEIERAASLPVCKYCQDQARAEDEYYSEPSQFTLARAATPPAARGSASPDADPAGAPTPPRGAPAQTSPLLSERQAAEMSPGPETTRPGPVSVRAGAQTPAGAVRSRAAAAPAGSSEEERAAQRDAWRKAQRSRSAALRNGRGTRAARQPGPGSVRIWPGGRPPGGEAG